MVAPVAVRDRLAGAVSIPIVDTHIHLFDTARPQGVPWPDEKDAVLYKPALPGRYRKVTQGLGIVGAIEIECSPWTIGIDTAPASLSRTATGATMPRKL